jgi:F-type H+-transporting ATPase subunit delta
MAELATIARPYAEALYQVARSQDVQAVGQQVAALAGVAGNEDVRQFADNPKVSDDQVFEVVTQAAGIPLSDAMKNFVRAVIENGRLAAMPEVATQFHSLVNASSGTADATIYSAFPMDDAALADVVSVLEKRFDRKLAAKVEVDSDLIGGIRVVVGDEVLDTSVRARLERMKVALSA